MSKIKVSNTPDVSAHRNLSPEEEKALEAGKSRWLPRMFQSYGTPIPELMASPLKTGLMFGLPAGIIGAGLGSAVGGAMHGADSKGYSGLGALIGGLGAGGLAALAAGADREAKNEGLEELMRRMPEGAAKRDLLADPQYQSDFLGWDNNKIVATARARYYRPTERFSKRTEDMADARERYNERNKTSSIHPVNKEISMSQSQSEKQAINTTTGLMGALGGAAVGMPIGGLAGGLYGALSAEKGKRLERALRLAGRGAVTGGLVGSGAGLGAGLMMPEGMGTLFGGPAAAMRLLNDPAGYALRAGAGATGGGALGAYLASRGQEEPAEKDEEKKEENKKAAQAILNNKSLTLAEKMAAYAELLGKQAGLPGEVPAGSYATRPEPKVDLAKEIIEEDMRRSAAPPVASGPTLKDMQNAIATPGAFAGGNKNGPDFSGLDNYGYYFKQNLKTVGDYGKGALKSIGSLFSSKQPDPTLLDQLKPYAPHLAVGGAGLGALALAHYLSKSKKKRRRPEAAGEDYDMPKAASINWYKLAREQQKRVIFAKAAGTEKAAIMGAAVSAGGRQAMRALVLKNMANRGLMGKIMPLSMGWEAAGPSLAQRFARLPQWARLTGGLTAAGGTGVGIGAAADALTGKDPSIMQQIMNYKYTPHIAAGLSGAGLLGGAAYMGSRAGKNEAKKKKKPQAEKKADLTSAGMGGAMGAGLGGAAGALYGALAPGHEEDPMTGRRRRRSRLMAALRGLAAGGVAGGVGGAALGHFMPGLPHGAMDAIGKGKQVDFPKEPSPNENLERNLAQATPAQRKLHEVIMQRNKPKPQPTPDPIELAKAQAAMQSMGEEPGSDPLLGPNAAMQAQMAQQ